MRSFVKSAVMLVSIAASAASAFAQNYPLPAAVPDPPAICTGCPGNNVSGEANADKPTYPYDTPLSLHTGRFVDSSSTSTVGDIGMRTVRSGIVRVAGNRLYLQLNAAVGAYTLDTFFSSKLKLPMVDVNTVDTGQSYGASRNPFEKLAKPDRFFYPESPLSTWTTPIVDSGIVIVDLDADDRGDLYLGTANFGWGIVSDPGDADGSHLPSVVQVAGDTNLVALLSIHNGSTYHVYHSNTSNVATLYDVTTAASPVFTTTRSGTANAFTAWSKYEAGGRVALRNNDGHVRVYTYADLVSGAAPLADLTPTAGRFFADLSFDDDGILWLAESTNSSAVNVLWKATPSGGSYTTATFDVYGTTFRPSRIHAANGYIAVTGRGSASSNDYDVRLLQVVGGSPVLEETDGFFGKYYHRAPLGYAQPTFTSPPSARIVVQGGKTYLFYSAVGLGDVYEISDATRITSMAPLSGDPSGGTAVSIYGTGFLPTSTATFDGIAASTTFVSPTQLTAIAPPHAMASVYVVVDAMTAPKQYTYEFNAPANVAATATSTSTVSLTWSAVPGATRYEVSRLNSAIGPTWTPIGIVTGTSHSDSGRVAEKTYLYRVRAGDATSFSSKDGRDAVTMMSDEYTTITAGSPILAAQLTTLRTRVNGVRSVAVLTIPSYTDPTPTIIRAVHLTELRTRLTEARTALGLATPAFTDAGLAAGTAVKAVHLQELIDLMR